MNNELTSHLKVHQLKNILYYWEQCEKAGVPNATAHADQYREELRQRNARQRKDS